MKNLSFRVVVSMLTSLYAAPLLAGDPLSGVATMGFGDVAAVKQKAVAGDPAAQVALGNSLANSFHASEALEWYQKAAAQGNVEAEYQVGRMLLFGAPGFSLSSGGVQPNPTEGLRWTFKAATNLHANACWNMGKAFRQALGTGTNLIAAYAWLRLFADTPPGFIVGRVEMNELALKMDTRELQQALQLVNQFKAGHWESPVIRAIPEGDPRLKLGGIVFGTKTPLAVINGKTLSEGESTEITLKSDTLRIKCLKIEKDSALIAVEGEDAPRLLRLK